MELTHYTSSHSILDHVHAKYARFKPYPLEAEALDKGCTYTEDEHGRVRLRFNDTNVAVNRPIPSREESIEALAYLQEHLPSEQFSALMNDFMSTNTHGIDIMIGLYKDRNNYNGLDDYRKRAVLSPPYYMLVYFKDCDEIKETLRRWMSKNTDKIRDLENLKIMSSLVLGYDVE